MTGDIWMVNGTRNTSCKSKFSVGWSPAISPKLRGWEDALHARQI